MKLYTFWRSQAAFRVRIASGTSPAAADWAIAAPMSTAVASREFRCSMRHPEKRGLSTAALKSRSSSTHMREHREMPDALELEQLGIRAE